MNLTDAPPSLDRRTSDAHPALRHSQFVHVENVVKKFGESTAVQNVDLSVGKGELFALLGSSGCGKSTLLRMLAGFETPTAGRIWVDGTDVTALPPYRRPVNMMFQSYALFPHMTVAENVAFGLKWEHLSRVERRERVMATLELVQMTSFSGRKPSQLSGGQQQRVALARSLAKQPKLLLLDEPMSALDRQIRQKTQLELANIIEKVGVTCIMVTHDQEEAMTMADRLAVMSAGAIVQVGTPREVYQFPNCRFTAGFVGTTNIFTGFTVREEADHVFIQTGQLELLMYINHGITGPVGMSVAVSVRPERVHVSLHKPTQSANWSGAVVVDVAYMGAHSVYHLRLPTGMIMLANVPAASASDENSPECGDHVFASWNASDAVVLTS
ncbi:ABC transporter ATP-binding protein [Paraburkholderia haematera]|uniref:Spermidine/putrescine import ATP-binding protein PotA n=1 Tax=Paraburkholderia haematera TaxID=2793077 RepID=A0ABN7LR09_9BURK|nr:ABC transporter ATP-binding protein [Paraburkholderia haematera]CAE6765025.1 Vitamin B12 import ATP-binding protein BtuD [Paraburkholderia haematera]